jgi:hypothetical protein
MGKRKDTSSGGQKGKNNQVDDDFDLRQYDRGDEAEVKGSTKIIIGHSLLLALTGMVFPLFDTRNSALVSRCDHEM